MGDAIELSTEEMAYLRAKETIAFVCQTQYPPFEFVDANGQHEGMMLDIIRWMAVEMGFKPVFMDMPFQQAQEAVLSGKADILTSLFYSDKRKERFEFTEPLFDVPASIFVKAERTDIKDINDLNGKTIAIQRGDYARDFLESQNIHFDTLDAKDFAEATNRVLTGKADAVIGDEQIVFYHIFSNRLIDAIKKVGEPLYIGKNCMASNRNNALLIRILNKGISKAKESGQLDKIGTKWLGTICTSPKSFLDRYQWHVAAVAGGILLILSLIWVWNIRLRILVRKKTADITCREQKLKESEEKYRRLFDTLIDIYYRVDSKGRIIMVFPSVTMAAGYQPGEVLGSEIRDYYVHPEERDRFIELLMRSGFINDFEVQMKRKDGSLLWVSFNARMDKDKAGNFSEIEGIARDIAERKRSEDALLQEYAFRNAIIDNVAEGLCVCHETTEYPFINFTIWNDRMTEITGYTEDEINRLGWYQAVYPDPELQAKAIDRMKRMRQSENLRAEEWEITRADGIKRILNISTSVLESGDGSVHVMALMQDITERKQTEDEKEKIEAQNRQLQKAESLGRMAGAIAHHFNNQLQAVMGNLELAMEELPDVNPIESLVSAMQAACKAAEVSALMLTYLGQTPGKHEPMDLSEACRQSLPLLQAAAPKGMILKADFPSLGPVIRANAGQIQQVLTNLVTNAWESAGKNQEAIGLTVKTVSHADIPASKRFPIDWHPQEIVYACMEVADTGCGISDKDIEKLFDPFFSSKFTGRGLGLSVVLGIVRSHGGVVSVDSEPGRGSVFRVFLPVSAEEVPRLPDNASRSPEMQGGCTVLLVEDEEMVRDMAKLMLTHLGFTVLEAGDGVNAVEVFRQHQDEIRCVLSDLTMPHMDGWETLAALRKLSPDIPVILSSGYDEVRVMAGEHPERPNAFLGKPYHLKGLSETIHRTLADKNASSLVTLPNSPDRSKKIMEEHDDQPKYPAR